MMELTLLLLLYRPRMSFRSSPEKKDAAAHLFAHLRRSIRRAT